MRTARQTRTKYLFHFQPFNRDHIETTLVRDEIYFSRPAAFNDPWDCRPVFAKALLRKPKIYTRHVDYFSDLCRRHGVPEDEVDRRASLLRADDQLMSELVDDLTFAMQAAIEEKYRIFCLSARQENILMWGHYAQNHTGVCFSLRAQSKAFCSALSVHYAREYPKIDLTHEDEALFVLQTLCTKARDWSYEQEYRLIAKEGETEGFLTVSDGFMKPERDALEAVAVGCLMPDENVQFVVDSALNRLKPVPVFVALQSPDRYELAFERIA